MAKAEHDVDPAGIGNEDATRRSQVVEVLEVAGVLQVCDVSEEDLVHETLVGVAP